jgi:hypothetical protein
MRITSGIFLGDLRQGLLGGGKRTGTSHVRSGLQNFYELFPQSPVIFHHNDCSFHSLFLLFRHPLAGFAARR